MSRHPPAPPSSSRKNQSQANDSYDPRLPDYPDPRANSQVPPNAPPAMSRHPPAPPLSSSRKNQSQGNDLYDSRLPDSPDPRSNSQVPPNAPPAMSRHPPAPPLSSSRKSQQQGNDSYAPRLSPQDPAARSAQAHHGRRPSYDAQGTAYPTPRQAFDTPRQAVDTPRQAPRQPYDSPPEVYERQQTASFARPQQDPAAGSRYVQDTQRLPHDTSRPVYDGRQTYDSSRQPQDPSASSRQVQNTQRPAHDTSRSVYDGRQTYDSSRQPQDPSASSRQVQDTQGPAHDTSRPGYDRPQTYDSPRQPQDPSASSRRVQDTQRPAHDASRPVQDRRQTYDSPRQPQDPAANSRQMQDTQQRSAHDTSRQSYDQRQTHDPPRQTRDPAANSRQVQDTPWSAHDTSRQSYDQRQTYDQAQVPAATTSSSRLDTQRVARDSQWPGNNTVSPASNVPLPKRSSSLGIAAPSQGPEGVDLTGQVRILPSPNQKFLWSIGTGAFTDVFKGEYHKVTAAGVVEPMYVAVKIFRASTNDDPARTADVSRRLIRESKVWLRLKHPNIQPYLGHCSDLGLSVALISPLCGSGTILKYIAIKPSANKLRLVQEVATGLKYLHSLDVIHGDLQCHNILVDEQGHAVLADFGRAKVIGEVGYSTQLLAGCAPYMAPELFPPSDVNVDDLFSKKSDVYAFGMLCYEIFTNAAPFTCYNAHMDWQIVPLIQQGKRPRYTTQVQCKIPTDMWRLMEACWVTARESRPSADLIVQQMH